MKKQQGYTKNSFTLQQKPLKKEKKYTIIHKKPLKKDNKNRKIKKIKKELFGLSSFSRF